MGNCGSTEQDSEEIKKNATLNKVLEKNKMMEDSVLKLLLLGAGQSGKSTFFKQMQQNYGTGHSDDERNLYKQLIYNNIINSVKLLIKHSEMLSDEHDTAISEENIGIRDLLDELVEYEDYNEVKESPITQEIATNVLKLWNDKGIQETYKLRAKFHISDSTKYFFDRLNDIVKEDYIPTNDDILRVRVRTTGIIEGNFVYEKVQFKVLDVGGQRNERKKWINCFDSVTAVLFVASLAGYDQVLFEDAKSNCMMESVDLFRKVCSYKTFENTSMILFLNKFDLFLEKIKTTSLKVAFPDFDGNEWAADMDDDSQYNKNVISKGLEFIEQKFRLEYVGEAEVYVHVTTATDAENFLRAFKDVKDIVCKRAFQEAGLIL